MVPAANRSKFKSSMQAAVKIDSLAKVYSRLNGQLTLPEALALNNPVQIGIDRRLTAQAKVMKMGSRVQCSMWSACTSASSFGYLMDDCSLKSSLSSWRSIVELHNVCLVDLIHNAAEVVWSQTTT